MSAHSRLRRLLAMLDQSPLPKTDPVRLELEMELLERLFRATALAAARRGLLLGARPPRAEA